MRPGNAGSHQEGPVETCLDAAFRYLSCRPRSESELRKHLRQRGFDGGCVDEVLSQLRKKGLADDSAFARFWVENRESFRPRSQGRVQRELLDKGIDSETIAQATAGIDEEASAYRAARRKARTVSTVDYDGFQRKLLGFLARRGYDDEVCQRTVNRIWQERLKEGQDAQHLSEQ